MQTLTIHGVTGCSVRLIELSDAVALTITIYSKGEYAANQIQLNLFAHSPEGQDFLKDLERGILGALIRPTLA